MQNIALFKCIDEPSILNFYQLNPLTVQMAGGNDGPYIAIERILF